MNIGIYIYDEAEVLDFSGPFEVFSTAARITGGTELFNVFLVSETGGIVSARGNFKVQPHYGFANHPKIDVLIVVGGDHSAELTKQRVLGWIQQQSKSVQLVASVCTGAFLLAEAKVLSNQKVTTHWEDIADLQKEHPALTVLEKQRWVDEGNIITSGGISAGIDMSLHLVSKIHSRALAENTAQKMEFTWSQLS